MLRLSRFTYIAAENTAHAMALLQEHGTDAVLMAGGTDVLVNIKQRLVTPKYVVAIRNLPELSTLRYEEDQWLTLGAGVTLDRLERDPKVASRFPALAHAAHLVSAPQI
ncbi:MAG TPA: FAD binding domain-containing protein, partial [Chloroflexota bacterium]